MGVIKSSKSSFLIMNEAPHRPGCKVSEAVVHLDVTNTSTADIILVFWKQHKASMQAISRSPIISNGIHAFSNGIPQPGYSSYEGP